MAVKQPIRLQPKPKGVARVIQRRNVPVLALSAIALALAILIFHDVLFPSTTGTLNTIRTALIGMGTVTNSVTATGSLVPSQQMNLGFKTAGTLTEVDVKVGDTVGAGQVLARLDTAPLQLALQQAQAALAAAAAQLSNTQSGTALQQATDQLSQAQQAYNNAVANQANDQATLNADNSTLSADQATYAYQQFTPHLQTDQANLAAAQSQWQSDQCLGATPPSPSNCTTDKNNITAAQDGISCLQTGLPIPGGTACSFEQQQMAAAYKTVSADQARVNADQARINADANQVQMTSNSVTSATDAYNSQAINRPATLAQQAAQVASTQASVSTAETNLNAATLSAPIAGVITGVSAQAGDSVAAGGSSTGAQAPGTTALLPSSGSSGTGASSGGGFISLAGTSSYLTVVSFAESDAAKVKAGQTGSVTFDAINGLSIPVHVLAVAGSATVTSNVVNYYVTLALDSTDPSLRSGLTTNATVITAQASNVLTVLNTALVRRGTQVFVNLLQSGKQVLTEVTLGIVGSTTSEVTSGVKVGDKVVLPTVSTTRSTTTGLGTGGGRFGGGGGGVVVGGG